ncbi:galactokinase [Clostridium caldaquaticum]|uniref:galactokinase n=1 Tax=Clostridium caldaquaticum TaxID=2940653 RepID=UPI0025742FB6|nr:galactokinase [Clostridium caldaquaticum]
MDVLKLKEEFNKIYGEGEVRVFHSPGRVNLIGEHIDYNGGYVFPCALEFGTFGLVRERGDRKVNLASTNFDLKVSVDLDNIVYKEEDDWANYPKGVMKVMSDIGYRLSGMDILISGNIPNGAGLSSSASLELLIAVIIDTLFNGGTADRVELVKLSQKAENTFVGVNCGIMDQFAVGMGKKNKAILLDCATLKYNYASVELGDYTLVIMNTNKRRALNESKYNERRAECDEALSILQKETDIKALCDLTAEEFDKLEHLLTKENVKNRAKHAVYENERTKKAYEALNSGCIEEFGKLLKASHDSLRDLYEVTGRELDTIVAESLKIEGCIGARMTGAGFGGCAIALVKKDKVDSFMEQVKKNYKELIGYEPSFYLSGIGEGTEEIILSCK